MGGKWGALWGGFEIHKSGRGGGTLGFISAKEKVFCGAEGEMNVFGGKGEVKEFPLSKGKRSGGEFDEKVKRSPGSEKWASEDGAQGDQDLVSEGIGPQASVRNLGKRVRRGGVLPE